MPEPQPPTNQAATEPTGTCVRCGAVHQHAHMVRLKSGRILCQSCVAVLRGKVGRKAVEAEVSGGPPREPAAPRPSTLPGVEDVSDPDMGLTPFPEGTDPYDAAEVDTVPCPKCGATVIFGMPTCEACGIILDDYWSEEDVLNPVSPGERRRRLLWRGAIFVGLAILAYAAWPTQPEQTRWESLLDTVFPSPGVGLDEESRGVQIHPTIQRVGRRIVVRNDDRFNWADVELKLNAGAGGLGGFLLTLPLLPSMQTMEFALVNFTKRDGSPFTPTGMRITSIDIRATTPEGLALWSKPDYVDPTEDTTVD